MGFEVPWPRPRRGRWKWWAWCLSLNLFLVGAVVLFVFGPSLALWVAMGASGIDSVRDLDRKLFEFDSELRARPGDGVRPGDGPGDGPEHALRRGDGPGDGPEHALRRGDGPEHALRRGDGPEHALSLDLLDPLLGARVDIETRAGYILRGGRLTRVDWAEVEIDGVELRTPWLLHFDTDHTLRWDAVRRITLVSEPGPGLD